MKKRGVVILAVILSLCLSTTLVVAQEFSPQAIFMNRLKGDTLLV